MAWATLLNFGLSSPRLLILLMERVKVKANQSRTSPGTAPGSTSLSSSSSSQRRLKWQSKIVFTHVYISPPKYQFIILQISSQFANLKSHKNHGLSIFFLILQMSCTIVLTNLKKIYKHNTVKPAYKGHSIRLSFIDSDLLYRGALYRVICCIEVSFIDSD